MHRFVLAALAIGLSTPAWGQAFNQIDHRYLYLQADYLDDVEFSAGGVEDEGDGYGGKAVVSMSPHAFFALEYHTIDIDDSDLDTTAIGLGLRTEVVESVDLQGSANYEHVDLVVPGLVDDDTGGLGLRLGLRFFLTDRLELAAEGRWADLGELRLLGVDLDVESRFAVFSGIFRFTDSLALVGEYLTGEYEFEGPGGVADLDRDDVRLGLRWYLDS